MNRRQALNNLLFFSLGLIAVGVGILVFWMFQPSDVLTVSNEPVPVKYNTIKAREAQILNVNFCKNIKAHGRLVRSIESTTSKLQTPEVQEPTLPECREYKLDDENPLKVPIPAHAEPDTYIIRFHIVYDINPLKRGVVEEFVSQPFQIVE